MVETLIISVLIKLIFKKDGSFSSQHIHDSEALREKGIHCVMDQDKAARKQGKAY